MLSAALKDRYQTLLGRYPVKRSALVPMLLFTQDEIGYVSDEAIQEICRILNLPVVEVVEVISYYSMLRRQPAGRCHLQVCTNISCMLNGGEALYDQCRERLGIGHKQTTADGTFSLEEVECIGACVGAPALQVNYDFYEQMTSEKLDQLLDRLARNRQNTGSSSP